MEGLTSWLCAITLSALCILVFVVDGRNQGYLTPLIVVFSVWFSVSWCVSLARQPGVGSTDWFHPAVLFTGLYLVYFVFSGIWLWIYHDNDSEFAELGSDGPLIVNQAFCLGFISLAAYGLGARATLAGIANLRQNPGHARAFRVVRPDSQAISTKELVIAVLVLCPLGLGFKIYHLAQFGALSTDILLYLSPTAANEFGLSISLFVIMMESMLDWAALLGVLYVILMYRKTGHAKNLWWILPAVFLVSMLDYLISGKRSAVIFFIVLPVIWFNYLVRPLSARTAITLFFTVFVAIIVLLLGRIVLPLITQGLVPTDYIGVNALDVVAFYLDSGEISTFDMVAATIAKRDEILRQAGGAFEGFFRFTFQSLDVFIPRLIWPDKPPYVDLSQIYRRVLIGPEEDMGIAPTVWGAGYLFFGATGFFALMFFIGGVYEAIYRYLRPGKGGVANVVLYSIVFWAIFQAIRFGTLGFVTLLVVQSMLVGIVVIWFLGRRRSRPAVRLDGSGPRSN